MANAIEVGRKSQEKIAIFAEALRCESAFHFFESCSDRRMEIRISKLLLPRNLGSCSILGSWSSRRKVSQRFDSPAKQHMPGTECGLALLQTQNSCDFRGYGLRLFLV